LHQTGGTSSCQIRFPPSGPVVGRFCGPPWPAGPEPVSIPNRMISQRITEPPAEVDPWAQASEAARAAVARSAAPLGRGPTPEAPAVALAPVVALAVAAARVAMVCRPMPDPTAVICSTRGLQRAVMAARDRSEWPAVRRALVRPVPIVAGLLGLFSACLNPHPDEQPTFNDSKQPGPTATTDVAPRAETCADNPLLAGCSPSTGAPVPKPGGTTSNGDNASAADAGSAGPGSDGGFDAGERDAGPVDAIQGAADAG